MINTKPYIDTTLADEDSNETTSQQVQPVPNTVRNFVTNKHIHVVLGILTAVVIATTMSFTDMTHVLYASIGRLGVFALIAMQIALSAWFNANINKMQDSTARIMFYAYFILLGITLSTILCAFSLTIIIIALIIATALSFGVK